jgi:hypothetical protein
MKPGGISTPRDRGGDLLLCRFFYNLVAVLSI